MDRIKNPVRFTTCFCLAPTALTRLGVLDPTLNADTKLFIDPMLLAKSRHREMKQAAKDFRDYFATLAKLLAVTKKPGDVAWRSAEGRLRFSEVVGTCLGYGAGTIAGSGFGPALRSQLLHTAKEIVDLGIRLLDAAESYHREVLRQGSKMPESVRELLPRLRDPAFTRVLLVTLPEATPVHEAQALQADLARAGIAPFAWVVNQSLTPVQTRDPVLAARRREERPFLEEVQAHSTRVAVLPWMPEPPRGASRLASLLGVSPN